VNFTKLLIEDNISLNYKIISTPLIGTDKEGNGHGLIALYSWHLPEWTEKNQEKLQCE
jgi:hypothetical protein